MEVHTEFEKQRITEIMFPPVL